MVFWAMMKMLVGKKVDYPVVKKIISILSAINQAPRNQRRDK